MMNSVYDRTEELIGAANMDKLKNSSVIVFGLGGVGGHAVEALARTGVGRLGIVDCDTVDITNVNRQIIALTSTVGKHKADAFKDRIADINGRIRVDSYREKLTAESAHVFPLGEYDYIVDAIDDTAAKILLIEKAKALGVPVISSMGAGNRMDPSRFKISDIEKTHSCPLAKKIRKELARRGITEVKVLFSDELPEKYEDNSKGPASIAFVTAVAGLLIAGEVVRDLLECDRNEKLHTHRQTGRDQQNLHRQHHDDRAGFEEDHDIHRGNEILALRQDRGNAQVP